MSVKVCSCPSLKLGERRDPSRVISIVWLNINVVVVEGEDRVGAGVKVIRQLGDNREIGNQAI